MKFDPVRRSAALLRFSDRALLVLDEDLFLDCVPCDTAMVPQGISTMDWGIAACCRQDVPDVIYLRGSPGGRLRAHHSRRGSGRRCKQYYYLLKPHLTYRILEESFMGIKPSYIKTMGTELLKQQRDNFSGSFDENKVQLGASAVIGSKRVRNRIAGYITRKMNTKRHA